MYPLKNLARKELSFDVILGPEVIAFSGLSCIHHWYRRAWWRHGKDRFHVSGLHCVGNWPVDCQRGRPVMESLMVSLLLACMRFLIYSRVAGEMKRPYDVTQMM